MTRDSRGIFQESIEIIPGMVFGFLTILNDSPKRDKSRVKYYLCECQCGTLKEISRSALVSKDTKSCGCFNRQSKQLEKGLASLNSLFYTCKKSAKDRGIQFSLTFEDYIAIITKNCFYCGSAPKPWSRYTSKSVTPETFVRSIVSVNGIDRFVNSLSYSKENCVPCCLKCNEMKMDRSSVEFIGHIMKIFYFQNNKDKI